MIESKQGDDHLEISKHNSINPNEGNIVQLVEAIFSQALQLNASDIHIEPLANYSRVRVRLDGILVELCRLPLARHTAILSRIKLLSEMDIAEKRLPQDGRLTASYDTRILDMRVASLPTIEGEKLAIRILDKSHNFMDLEQLGFNDKNYTLYNKLIRFANGIVLTTGPTGSGKSTTLYATLTAINNIDKNIVTIEDPVEYQLAGINQVAVNTKAGLDFNNCLRAIVRQDPNIVMIGEIRDSQTAKIAVQAALTGHLVFSTLHTNNALGTISRLLDMGIEPFLLLSALRGVLSQRLVRKICPHCKERYFPTELEKVYLKNSAANLYRGRGCSHCHQTGYAGRIALQELIVIDDTLANMIIHKEPEAKQIAYLRQQGFQSLQDDGIEKVLKGITTIDELLRTAIIS